MPPRRRTDPEAGRAAVDAWARGAADRRDVTTAVRFTLEELADRAPGNSVEVRVPPRGRCRRWLDPGTRAELRRTWSRRIRPPGSDWRPVP
nr:hypothetical protein GCM10025730_28980 [Promicromonospora thailandica]